MRWLNEKVWPFEAKLNEDDIYYGTCLGLIEMIKSGTTAFADMYYREDVIGRTASGIGLRGFLGSPILGEGWKVQIEDAVKLLEMFKDNPLIVPLIAPHSPYTCSENVLKEAGETARKYKMPIHIHIAETEDEINIISNQYKMSPLEFCTETGLFDGNHSLAAHCVYVTDEDIEILKRNNINVVHNPQSNMKLASGIAPVVKILEKGVNVALGTDGASSNNNLDMIDEMQSAALLQKLANKDATALGSYEAIKMATVNGAKAIGMENSLGKISPGYLADIILIDLMKPHMVPLFDIYSNMVFSAHGGDVKTVIVNGNILMENYYIKNIDENYVLSKVQTIVEDILKR
jgi:5-methylthioadenosine/S-adenosylhomocysteine deaminase